MHAATSAVLCASLVAAHSIDATPSRWGAHAPASRRLTEPSPSLGACESLAASAAAPSLAVASFRQRVTAAGASAAQHQPLRHGDGGWWAAEALADHSSQHTLTRCGVLPVACPWRGAGARDLLFGADEASGAVRVWDVAGRQRVCELAAPVLGSPVRALLPRGLPCSNASWHNDWLLGVLRPDFAEVWYMAA